MYNRSFGRSCNGVLPSQISLGLKTVSTKNAQASLALCYQGLQGDPDKAPL